jgi:hypothetical protein
MDYVVRRAKPSGLGSLVDFTLSEAQEAEGISLDRGKTLDLRLYLHKNSERAIEAYLKSGFTDWDDRIMRMNPGRRKR